MATEEETKIKMAEVLENLLQVKGMEYVDTVGVFYDVHMLHIKLVATIRELARVHTGLAEVNEEIYTHEVESLNNMSHALAALLKLTPKQYDGILKDCELLRSLQDYPFGATMMTLQDDDNA